MWSYYGSKSRVVDLYPKPKHGKIIEPFAGSARYALKHFDNDVLLIDKYEVVVGVWQFLQKCSPNDVLKLPKLKAGDKIEQSNFDCIEQFWLAGFLIKQGGPAPVVTVSKWGEIRMEGTKKRIACQLDKIRHWEIRLGCYQDVPNEKATWFIDPPYQVGGHKYKHNKIDYGNLREYSMERQGLVIVCENTAADWMQFKPISKNRGVKYTTTEAVYINDPAYTINEQLKITL